MPNTGSGKIGERFAAEYLQKSGFEILCMNFKCRFGEIDVIARNESYLVFVEVKTRRTGSTAHPFESITPGKRAKVVKTAQYYLLSHPTALQPRFDAAAVFVQDGVPEKIEYLENAFY